VKIKYVLFSFLALAAWMFFHQMGKDEARVRQTVCLNNLKLISRAIKDYRKDHGENYPLTLEELHPKYLEDRRSLRCFSVYGSTMTNAVTTSYIYFRPVSSSDPLTVIVRDKPENHSSLHGHSILYANGETVWINERDKVTGN
jgi:hypothetical protein